VNKVRNYLFLVLNVLMVVGMITFTGCSKDEEEEPAPPDIVDIINATPGLSTLSSAIEIGGSSFALKGTGPFTILAPTNDAFANLPAGVLNSLYNNPDKLSDLILYHTLSGGIKSSEFTTGTIAPFYKRDGLIEVEAIGPSVKFNGSANIVEPDNEGTNGVVQVIDEVLVPVDFEFPN
jgi:uncharacterized surface protein with fasciclin (FAS1) repeats